MQGKFIVIDGIDGTGKTEQIQSLVEALEFSDFTTHTLKFPNHESLSGEIVKNFEQDSLTPQARAILYSINHLEDAREIREALDAGKIVIAQRFVLANLVHQSMNFALKEERINFYKWLDNLEYNILQIPKPDLNIILDAGETIAHKNIRAIQKPRPEQSINYLEKCRKIYLEVASLMPNTKVVECSQSGEMHKPELIHNQIWQIVRRMVLNKTKDQL